MPQRGMPWVRNGWVVTAAGEHIIIDTAAWFEWLAGISSFCHSSPDPWVRLAVRREKRGSHAYWYAYSRIDRKLHNVFLGKCNQLTRLHLDNACQRIRRQAARKEATAT